MEELTHAEKIRRKNIEKYGSEEAWKDALRQWGSKGGKGSRGYGFAHGKLDPIESGRKGGKISKRKKA